MARSGSVVALPGGLRRVVLEDGEGVPYPACQMMGSKDVGHARVERNARLFAAAGDLRRMVGTLAALVEAAPPASPEVFEALAEAKELLRETE